MGEGSWCEFCFFTRYSAVQIFCCFFWFQRNLKNGKQLLIEKLPSYTDSSSGLEAEAQDTHTHAHVHTRLVLFRATKRVLNTHMWLRSPSSVPSETRACLSPGRSVRAGVQQRLSNRSGLCVSVQVRGRSRGVQARGRCGGNLCGGRGAVQHGRVMTGWPASAGL